MAPISPAQPLTTSPEAAFFLAPELTLHRQYEALRAYFVAGQPSQEVACLFGYTPGSFRVLCHQFRHDPAMRATFFAPDRRSPSASPAHDRVRDLAIGKQRNSHVMDLVEDQGIALFAGLNVVPKRSYLAAYSSRIDHDVNLRLMAAWSDEVHQAGLPHGHSFDVDFHTIAANSGGSSV